MTPVLRVRDLEVRYGDSVALTGVDLDVPAASSLAVIGPNGSGKSTLLNAIAGVVKPSAGTVVGPGGAPTLVLQSTEVDRSLPMTVRDAVSLGRYTSVGLLRPFRSTDREAVDRALRRLEIEDLVRRQIHELSGGQRQRVLVAQGLAQDSNLLLLDEPVTGLDVVSRKVILDVVDEEVAAGRTVILTTHSLEEAQRCGQVLLLDTRPIACGPPAEVLVAAHLRQAFGGRVLDAGDDIWLEDPHHDHLH